MIQKTFNSFSFIPVKIDIEWISVYKQKGSVLLFLLLEKHFVKIVKWGMSLVKRKKWKLSQK